MTGFCGNVSPITGECIIGCRRWEGECHRSLRQREQDAASARESIRYARELCSRSSDGGSGV